MTPGASAARYIYATKYFKKTIKVIDIAINFIDF